MPRGRPQKKKTTLPSRLTLSCASCGKVKRDTDFYISYNPIHLTKRLPYCKECLKKMISNEKGKVTLDKLQETLKLLDRPYNYELWKISLEDKMDSFGCYMKNLSLKQNRELTWKDSVFTPQLKSELNYENTNIDDKGNPIVYNVRSLNRFEIEVTDELVDKWGYGYKDEEIQAFEKKYQLLKNNYPERTAMHTEALLNYIRYRVKEEIATSQGNVKEAKEWGSLAKDAATAAKINPSQLSIADLQDGLTTFGQLSRAVEQAVDIIPILPHFKEKPQDKADFTIWCYINYVRELKGLPLCEYKDIWRFYNERKKEYENRFDFLQDKEDLVIEEEGEEQNV